VSTFVGSTEAARLLGVAKPTLYAYVSRGLVTRRTAADGRTSLYDRAELEQLVGRTRRRGGDERPTIDVAIASAVTTLGDHDVLYRGHSAAALARVASFEHVAELLWTGLPPSGDRTWPVDRAALDRCRAVIAAAAVTDPMEALVLAATALPSDPSSSAPAAARRLLAIVPSVLGGRLGGSIAERLATAWVRRPSDELVIAISRALVLLADHELATSTLAVRVACSVRAEPGAAFCAGLHVIRAPLHGGASRSVADLLAATGRVGAREAVRAALAPGRRLPGFGHLVYRDGDPRVAPLLEAVRTIPTAERRLTHVDELLAEAGRTVTRLPNADLALGALLHVGGLPHDAPLFAVARIAGWAAHYDEESAERPLRYRGVARAR
jgi:citrate synthase